MNKRFSLLRALTVICTILLSGSGLTAAGSDSLYVVVLNDSAGSAQPDIPALGGEVLHQSQNRRVVRISAAGIRALAAHRGVKYIQRVEVDGSLPPLPFAPRLAATAVATNASPAPTWYSGEYVYDGDGNITAIGTAASQAGDGGSEAYTYDSATRLVQAVIDHGTTDSEKYTYDSFGNLVDTTRTASPSTATPASPATNRLTGVTYDAVGNTLSEGGSTSYVWDGLNMMRAKVKSTETALYVYTADDERIGAYENGEQRWMIRDLSNKVLREWIVLGGVWMWREDHVYRNGALAAGEREPAEGGTRHFHLDHLGTPRLITDANATRIAAHDYYPFGVEKTDFRQEMLDRGTTWPEPMKFTGHERDFSGGISSNNRNQLDYMHARYYSPVWGRFLTVDPGKDWDQRQPQSWNMYAYVRNSPVNRTDPTGRRQDEVIKRIELARKGKAIGPRDATMRRPLVIENSPLKLFQKYATVRANVGSKYDLTGDGDSVGAQVKLDIKKPSGRAAVLDITMPLISINVTATGDGFQGSATIFGVKFGKEAEPRGKRVAGLEEANNGYEVTDQEASVSVGTPRYGGQIGLERGIIDDIRNDLYDYIGRKMQQSIQFNEALSNAQP